nr:PIN domain-containing protein [Mesorhizobium liriopis]
MDTNIISDIARNSAGFAAQRFAEEPRELLYTSVVVSAEVLFGLVNGTSADTHRKMTAVLQGLRVVGMEPPVAEVYASVRAGLKKAGRELGPNDMFIAAHALVLNATLVTADRAFRHVPGLRIENWLLGETAAS